MTNKAKKRVIIVMPTLGCGGAERIILSLCKRVPDNIELTVAVIRLQGGLVSEFRKCVDLVDLGGRLLWPINLIRTAMSIRPASIMSTIYDVNMVVLLIRSFFPSLTKVIVRDAIMPSAAILQGRFPLVTKILYRVLYPRADSVVVLGEHMRRDLMKYVPFADGRVEVINNTVEPERYRYFMDESKGSGREKILVAVGRLCHQKGFDALIGAFYEVRKLYPDYKLFIVGCGVEEENLRSITSSFGLDEEVIFTGMLENPLKLVVRAEYFVLSSRFEGMSNAMLEALCVGTPVIATVENTGADEFVRDGVNGYMTEACTRNNLALVLKRALQDTGSINRNKIATDSQARLSVEIMADRYFRVLGN